MQKSNFQDTVQRQRDPYRSLSKRQQQDVLVEVLGLARRRLIDASDQFQDVAFEMEWRLEEYHRLERAHRTLEEQLLKVEAELSQGIRAGRLAAESFHSLAGVLGLQLAGVRRQLNAATEEIIARNGEGLDLQEEVQKLEAKVAALERALLAAHRSVAPPTVRPADATAALMHLSLAHDGQGDGLDWQTLAAAAAVVQKRLRG